MRERVESQRFSISGYPCLYLASSTYLAWLELGKPNINLCHASQFEVVKNSIEINPIRLFDITNIHGDLVKKSENSSNNWDSSILRFLTLWPLIYATSVRVKYPSSYFKPEYIISQLLMQLLKDTKFRESLRIHGVKYSSTRLESSRPEYLDYNLAIPIHMSSNEPYCSVLFLLEALSLHNQFLGRI